MNALTFCVGGQGKADMSQLLFGECYEVWGTSRHTQISSFVNLKALAQHRHANLRSLAPTDFRSVLSVRSRYTREGICFFAGQSSVGLKFEQPAETLKSIAFGMLDMSEVVRLMNDKVSFDHANSSECFADVGKVSACEATSFGPRSPYAVAKISAHSIAANYREAYGLYACNGILFNHESPLLSACFVTRKIVDAAVHIAGGSGEQLKLGRLDIARDWGWASEYLDATWHMLQNKQAQDYVISTEATASLEDFVSVVVAHLGLDWQEQVVTYSAIHRPSDISLSQGSALCPERELGWRAKITMPRLAQQLGDAALNPSGPWQHG